MTAVRISYRSANSATISAIRPFVDFRVLVSASLLESIRRALMGLGVEFINENGGGPGVRLRERQRQKKTK